MGVSLGEILQGVAVQSTQFLPTIFRPIFLTNLIMLRTVRPKNSDQL